MKTAETLACNSGFHFMQRLNIPFQHGRTKSSNRHMQSIHVWAALGIGIVVCIAAFWRFPHTGVMQQAPEDTEIIVRFPVSRLGWDNIESTLTGIELISQRPVSVTDLKSFVSGEFALFVGKNGHRMLIVHANASHIPRTQLSAAGVVIQELSENIYVLSDRKEALTSTSLNRTWKWLQWSPFSSYVGDVYLPSLHIAGTMRRHRSTQAVEWRFLGHIAAATSSIPQPEGKEVVLLSTPVLPKEDTSSLPALESLLHGLFSWDSISTAAKQAEIAIAQSADLESFYIKMQPNDQLTDQRAFIRLISALRTPTTRTLRLPDGTRAQELVTDPASVTVESVNIAGQEGLRVAIGDNETLYGLAQGTMWIFTNDRAWLERPPKSDLVTGPCSGTRFGAKIDILASALSRPDTYWDEAFSDLAGQFSALGVSQGLISTKLTLCR